MHAHGPSGSLVSWMIAGERSAGEERRLRHLAALAGMRSGQPSLLSRTLARFTRRPADELAPALECCAVA